MQWLICVHSDDTSGHRQIAPSQFSYIVVAIYHHVTDNNNKLNFTITVCNG